MLKEEKLDVFLDAFLDGKKPAQETDLDSGMRNQNRKKRFLGSAGCTDSAKTQGKAVKTYDCIYVFDFNFNSGYNLDWNHAF